jgi:hypothetical protein
VVLVVLVQQDNRAQAGVVAQAARAHQELLVYLEQAV